MASTLKPIDCKRQAMDNAGTWKQDLGVRLFVV
jgi:hypothetical protein